MINLPEKNSTQVNCFCWMLLMWLWFMFSNSVSRSLWAVVFYYSRQSSSIHQLVTCSVSASCCLNQEDYWKRKHLKWVNVFFFLPRPAKVLTPLCRKKIIWIWGILRYSCFHRVRQSCIMMVLSGPVKTTKEIQSKRREGSFSALSDNEVDGCTKSSQEVNDEVLLSRCFYNI